MNGSKKNGTAVISAKSPMIDADEEKGNGLSIIKSLQHEITLTNNEPSKEEQLQVYFEQYRLDLNQRIEEPPICLSINDVKGKTPIGTYGNFLAVIGKAKAKKTFFVSMLAASYIKGSDVYNTIFPSVVDGKNLVILFDTEQAKHHIQRVGRRILHLAETTTSENLQIYCLRTLPTKERLAFIEQRIYKAKNEGLGLVIIDGIRDLIFDINDGKEASDITSYLMKWSEELEIQIIVVLHQNKGDNNARGHVGTEIVNKAETVISVAVDGSNNDISIVSGEYCRDRQFEPFAFKISDNGMPYILNEFISTNKNSTPNTKNRKVVANEIPDQQHFEILKAMFKNLDNPTHRTLTDHLPVAFQQYGVDLAEKRTSQFIAYYNSKNWLTKEQVKGVRYPVYRLALPV